MLNLKILVAVCFFYLSSCDKLKKNREHTQKTLKRLASLKQENIGLSWKMLNEKKPNKNLDSSFILLDSVYTGINFQNKFTPENHHRSQLQNSFIASGVAIGDYNSDGLPDIFLTRQKDGGALYKNLGRLKFVDVTKKLGLADNKAWSTGATFVDINNDGLLDLYVCGFNSPNRLYINEKTKFTEKAKEFGLDFSGASVSMAFADYDCDGDLDAYLLTNRLLPASVIDQVKFIRQKDRSLTVHPESHELGYFIKPPNRMQMLVPAGQYDYLFRNDGGKFVDATVESGIGRKPYYGLSAIWWDYNDDGLPDLYVANDYIGPDHLFRNNGYNKNGNITFTDVIADALPHTPWFSMGADFSDINNDGKIDFLASDMAGSNHYRDKLSMGSMSGPDSDAWFLNFPTPPQYMRNTLFLNTGTNRFMEIAYLAGLAKTDWTWTVRFADFDSDGYEDVYFTNGMSRDFLNGDIIDSIRSVMIEPNGGAEKELELWEKEKPYKLDNQVYKNFGDFKFKNMSSKWGFKHYGVSTGSTVGDLDLDGDLDIVVNGFNEPIRLYRNDLIAGHSLAIMLKGRATNLNGIGAKIVLDTGVDSLVMTRYISSGRGFMSSSEPVAYFGLGSINSVKKITVYWPSGREQVLNDVPSGFIYTINEPEDDSKKENKKGFQTQEKMFGLDKKILSGVSQREKEYDDFKRQKLLPNKLSQLGPGIAWGDVDGDGDDDFFMGGASGYLSQLYLNDGNGNFKEKNQKSFNLDINSEDMGAMFFDSDGDDDLDLYVVSGGVECVEGDSVLNDRIYLNDGFGNYKKAKPGYLPDIRKSGSIAIAADLNKDNMLELFVGVRLVPGKYPEPGESYILSFDGTKYIDATNRFISQENLSGMVTSAIFSDVNNDGQIDLLVAYDWGPIKYFQNKQGRLIDLTDASGLGDRFGWYNSINSGDFDSDGDFDYVVGNIGLNTKYMATKEKPEILYFGDFEGNGIKRIVEAKFENGICLPHRGLGCSSGAMPMIKEKLPTYHKFAITPLSGIYTEALLNNAQKFEVNSLESGIIFNNTDDSGNVVFEFESLPRLAQSSPVFGTAVCDINGDGHQDIYLVQNFFGPQPETGYMDGGVSILLLGRGGGEFSVLDPQNSGLIVPDDATSLTINDFNNDNRPDFVVGVNNGKPKVFMNKMKSEMGSIRFNNFFEKKNYFGTRIWLHFDDGFVQLYEVVSSASYLSQSSPIVFYGRDKKKSELSYIRVRWPNNETEIFNHDNLLISVNR